MCEHLWFIHGLFVTHSYWENYWYIFMYIQLCIIIKYLQSIIDANGMFNLNKKNHWNQMEANASSWQEGPHDWQQDEFELGDHQLDTLVQYRFVWVLQISRTNCFQEGFVSNLYCIFCGRILITFSPILAVSKVFRLYKRDFLS